MRRSANASKFASLANRCSEISIDLRPSASDAASTDQSADIAALCDQTVRLGIRLRQHVMLFIPDLRMITELTC
jgi:hypothetical protein